MNFHFSKNEIQVNQRPTARDVTTIRRSFDLLPTLSGWAGHY